MPRWMLVVGIGGGSILGAAEAGRARGGHPRDRHSPRPRGPRLRCRGRPARRCWPGCRPRRPSRTGATGPRRASDEIFFLTTLDRAQGFVDTVEAVVGGPAGARARDRRLPPADPPGCGAPLRAASSRSTAAPPAPRPPWELSDHRQPRRLRAGRATSAGPTATGPTWVFSADPATTALTRTVKGIFDPNNVMNPGKLCFPAARRLRRRPDGPDRLRRRGRPLQPVLRAASGSRTTR